METSLPQHSEPTCSSTEQPPANKSLTQIVVSNQSMPHGRKLTEWVWDDKTGGHRTTSPHAFSREAATAILNTRKVFHPCDSGV